MDMSIEEARWQIAVVEESKRGLLNMLSNSS